MVAVAVNFSLFYPLFFHGEYRGILRTESGFLKFGDVLWLRHCDGEMKILREKERKLLYAPLFPVTIYSRVLPLVKGEGEYLITSDFLLLFMFL